MVAQGQVVTVRFVEFDEEETFLLGSREEAATTTLDVYSPTSPLGGAVLGANVGETVSYSTPAGKTLNVEILRAESARLTTSRRPGTRCDGGRAFVRAQLVARYLRTASGAEDRDHHDAARSACRRPGSA